MTTGLLAGLVALLAAAQAPDAPAYAAEVRVVQVRGAMSEGFEESLESWPGMDATNPGVPFLKAAGPIGGVPVRMEGDRLEINEGKDSPEVVTVFAARITLLPRTDAPGPLQPSDVSSWLSSVEPWGPPQKTVQEALEFADLTPDMALKFANFLSGHWPKGDAPAGQAWYPPFLAQDGVTDSLPYFEHERGNYYRLKRTPRDLLGLVMGIAASPGPEGQIDVDFLYHKQAVTERAVVKGTRIQAGTPVSEKVQAEQSLRLTPGRWIGMRWRMPQPPESQEFVFLRVTPEPMPELPRMCAAEVRVFRFTREEGEQVRDSVVPWDGAERVSGDAVPFREVKLGGAATSDLGGGFGDWLADRRHERIMGHQLHLRLGHSLIKGASMMDLLQSQGRCQPSKPTKADKDDKLFKMFDPTADEAMFSVEGTKTVVAEYEYRESVPEEVSGYCAGLGLMPAEGPADLRVEVAAYVALPWPKPTGLRRLWQARPDPATDKQSFRYRFGTAEGEWTGFLRAVADGYAVMLVRFEDATAKTWAFYEDLNAPKPEPAAEVK